jgi:hypothetical protein
VYGLLQWPESMAASPVQSLQVGRHIGCTTPLKLLTQSNTIDTDTQVMILHVPRLQVRHLSTPVACLATSALMQLEARQSGW